MHNVMAPDSGPAFTKETLDHVCELVDPSPDLSPRFGIGADSQIAMFLQDLGHFTDDSRSSSKVADSRADEVRGLVDRGVEAVALLSLRWYTLKHHTDVPEMSDYEKHKWLPPAFSYLVGQILWRHRAGEPLQSNHAKLVENLCWITSVPGAQEDMLDQCNVVFHILTGTGTSVMKLSQWRKVVDIIAANPELRQRVRRCDAVRACYGDALSYSEGGMTKKNFRLMLVKTADLMGVHPVVLFQELAGKAGALEAAQKAQKDGA